MMYKLPRAICLLIVMMILSWAACSDSSKSVDNQPPPDQVTESIGPAGGTISLNQEAELMIPAGALASTVSFTMKENTTPATPPDTVVLVSKVFSIEPSGTNFSVPCTLSIAYDEALLAGQDESSLQMHSHHAGVWSHIPADVDEVNNVASGEINGLSDFSVTVYVRTAPSPGMSAMLDASVTSIKYWTDLWSQLHRMLRYIDHRDASMPAGITYNKTSGRFTFELDVDNNGESDHAVHGFVLGGPLDTSWFCTDSAGGICIDSILIPDTAAGPPAAIADGLHMGEVATITWFADADMSPGQDITGVGSFFLHMLSHDAYNLILPRENRFYPSDTSSFEVTSQSNNWNLTQYLPPGTNWSLDGTTWFWPLGTTEFVTRIAGDTDSLYALLVYGYDDTLGNIHAYYGADTADASIDWTTWLIGD